MGRSPVPGGRLPGGSGSSRPGRGAGTGTSQPKQPSAPLASFSGTLRRLTGKVLELQTDNDQTLELRCSGKTKFYRESKKIKAADLKPGDDLVVEVRHEIDQSMSAVNVYLQKASKPGSGEQ
jgi:hypothetical protein